MEKNKLIYILPLIILFSFILGLYFNEDSLGGGKADYYFHEKFFFHFLNDFNLTFSNYGTGELYARNSPIFYILYSLLLKIGLSIKTFKIINVFFLSFYIMIFIKCLKLKFNKIDASTQILFSSIILLSPTIRTMVVWTYPLYLALLFFLLSIYFFLKFELEIKENKKFKYSLCNTLLVALSAYITPNFAVFGIFFVFNFLHFFKNSKRSLIIILTNLGLALPAIYYYFINDFYLFKYSVLNLENEIKYNFSNKIIIITSIVFFYFIPFITIDKIKEFKKTLLSFSKFSLYVFSFTLINIIFFNYPNNIGGGIFFHFSNNIFNSGLLIYIIFSISLFFFKVYGVYNFRNLILFLCLILFNLQISIYHKYFDPLTYFLLLFVVKFTNNKKGLVDKNLAYKYIVLYSFFLIISLLKGYINY